MDLANLFYLDTKGHLQKPGPSSTEANDRNLLNHLQSYGNYLQETAQHVKQHQQRPQPRGYTNHAAAESQPTLGVHKQSPAEVEEIFNAAQHPSGREEEEEEEKSVSGSRELQLVLQHEFHSASLLRIVSGAAACLHTDTIQATSPCFSFHWPGLLPGSSVLHSVPNLLTPT